MQQKIGMAEVLKYPSTSVPFCLNHVDGSANSTPKSNLLNYIDLQFVIGPENKKNYVCCKTMEMFLHATSSNI